MLATRKRLRHASCRCLVSGRFYGSSDRTQEQGLPSQTAPATSTDSLTDRDCVVILPSS